MEVALKSIRMSLTDKSDNQRGCQLGGSHGGETNCRQGHNGTWGEIILISDTKIWGGGRMWERTMILNQSWQLAPVT